MSRALSLVAVLGLALLSSGCMAAYTDIRKVDDNTYVLTRTKQGFFRTYGTAFICNPVGQSSDLHCTEVDSP